MTRRIVRPARAAAPATRDDRHRSVRKPGPWPATRSQLGRILEAARDVSPSRATTASWGHRHAGRRRRWARLYRRFPTKADLFSAW